MSLLEKFMAYAAAFEQAYATDDWSALDPHFTEDAVYETIASGPFSNRTEGREAVKVFFKMLIASFDRRFDTRAVEVIDGPTERSDRVWFRWAATYTRAGLPALRMEGEETVVFADDRIKYLVDRIPDATTEATARYMAEHDARLKPIGG